jgi:RNA polymerase sigma factor (sigma-70 family)
MSKVEEKARAERGRVRAHLMERMQQGDSDACRALLDDIGPSVMQFLRRRVPDSNEVEDAYQEVLMALYEARHTYQRGRPLEPWLFAIARNIAADHMRRRWSRASWEELVDTPPERAEAEYDSPSNPPDLGEALAKLPRVQREAFAMLKLEGLSLEGAAERAGVSVGAWKVRAHRAYKTLRKLISG